MVHLVGFSLFLDIGSQSSGFISIAKKKKKKLNRIEQNDSVLERIRREIIVVVQNNQNQEKSSNKQARSRTRSKKIGDGESFVLFLFYFK
jgi:Ribonuclease G/E